MSFVRHVCICLVLAGCSAASTVSGNLDTDALQAEVAELTGPAPSANLTPMEPALQCVAQHGRNNNALRIAVSDITDGTGARNNTGEGSALLTQRPDLMFTVGLAKTGVRVINRSSTRVAEWEMGQAMERRLGDGATTFVEGEEYEYRPVTAGSILGSTHYVTGALTEVNWNISSSTAEVGLFGLGTGARLFYISVAADLIVTNTQTTEIVLARSYQKQIVGREINVGTFRFFEIDEGDLGPVELFDLAIGDQQNEPVQRAVRWLIEMAAYDIAATLTHTNDDCDYLIESQSASQDYGEATDSTQTAELAAQPAMSAEQVVVADVETALARSAPGPDVYSRAVQPSTAGSNMSESDITNGLRAEGVLVTEAIARDLQPVVATRDTISASDIAMSLMAGAGLSREDIALWSSGGLPEPIPENAR